jgi:hypothetical protein
MFFTFMLHHCLINLCFHAAGHIQYIVYSASLLHTQLSFFYSLSTHITENTFVLSVEISWITYYAKMLKTPFRISPSR